VDKLRTASTPAEVSIEEELYATLLFREVQQFRQGWIWFVLACSSLAALTAALMPFFLEDSWTEHPILNVILIGFGIIFGVFFPILFYSAKLITEVRTDGLYISFYPLLFKRIQIPFDSIVRSEIITYHPLRDYGGWGIRYGPEGKALNVSGDRGVLLELKNGEKILIGSHQPEQLGSLLKLAR
jgi:hypothetical protein